MGKILIDGKKVIANDIQEAVKMVFGKKAWTQKGFKSEKYEIFINSEFGSSYSTGKFVKIEEVK